MMATKREAILFSAEKVTAEGQVIRAPPVFSEDADTARLLLWLTKIGSPTASETLTVRPLWYDDRGKEYVDANTTYGSFTITGEATDLLISVDVPNPGRFMGLKVTGAGSLSATTGYVVDARYILTSTIGG